MTDQPINSVLANLAVECDKLAALAGEIDRVIGRLTFSECAPETGASATLQRIDLLRQSLECVTEYLEELAEQVGDGLEVDPEQATRGLKLRELAGNLAGAARPDGRNIDQEISFF